MTVETRSPTSYYSDFVEWYFPENALVEDDEYAWAETRFQIEGYYAYGFDGVLPAYCLINKVEVGLDFAVTVPEGQSVCIRVSKDGGSSWSDWSDNFSLKPRGMLWVDVSAYGFLREGLLDANFRVEIKYTTAGGAGCPEKEAWSGLLYWIPTRVTYEEIAPPEKRVFGDGLFWRKS